MTAGKRIAFLLPIVCLLALGGCKTLLKTQPFMAVPEDGAGYAVVAIRLNAPGIAPGGYFSNIPEYNHIVATPTGGGEGGEKHHLWRWDSHIGGESIYVGSLPAGEYHLTSGYAHRSDGQLSYALEVPIAKELGSFQVMPNVITDLGVLAVSHTVMEGNLVSLFGRWPSDSRLADIVRAYLSDSGKSAPRENEIGWNETTPSSYSLASTEFLRLSPRPSGRAIVDPADRLLIPATSGDLVIRDPSGSWHRVATESTSVLRTVAATSDGVFVGGSDGWVSRASDVYADDWERIDGLPDNSEVIHLDLSERGELYAVVLEKELGLHYTVRNRKTNPVHGFKPAASLSIYIRESGEGGWRRVRNSRVPTYARPAGTVMAGDHVIVHVIADLADSESIYKVDLEGASISALKEYGPIRLAEIGRYDEHSFLLSRNVEGVFVTRDRVSLLDVETGESTGSVHERMLSEISLRARPTLTGKEQLVAFGTHPDTDGLPDSVNETDPVDGLEPEEHPVYGPDRGLYFVAKPQGRWEPFALLPRPCAGERIAYSVADTFVQWCQYGGAYSTRIGSSDWQKESSSESLEYFEEKE